MDKEIRDLIEKNWGEFDKRYLSTEDRESGENTDVANAFAKVLYKLGALEILKALERSHYLIIDTKCTCWRCQGLDKDPYEDEEEGGT
jgi:hypothetical protein